MDLVDATYLVVHDSPGGASSLAPRLGKSVTQLNHECSRTGGAKMGLLDAERITVMTADLRILEAWALNAGQMLVPLPLVTDEGDLCMVRLGEVAREFADLCHEVAGDVADGRLSDNELARCDREMGELIARVHALRVALAALNLRSKPRGAAA